MKRRIIRLTPLLVAVAVSIALLAALLWQRSPVLAVALLGPVVALVLYERSIKRGRAAMRLALTDPLTGLGNQRAFRDRLGEELARGEASDRPLALCVLDVDDFKRINDERGHPAGDRVLMEVARRLRRDGEAYRLGGDEFALLLPGHDSRDAAGVAAAVVARAAAMSPAEEDRVTISAGISTYPDDGATFEELTVAADARLYLAKRRGGNGFEARGPRVRPACGERSGA